MKTMTVTSPILKGPQVLEAQNILNGKNIFKQDYLLGPVDGDFGPLTGRACIRAKYWCGYAEKDMSPIYGDQLHNMLVGKKKLPLINKRRRAARIKASGPRVTPLRIKALNNAIRDIGIKEIPAGSNKVKFSLEWNMIGPWCNMAVSLWYIEAGSKAFVKGRNWAYVPWFEYAAEQGMYGLAVVGTKFVQPGDPVTYNWQRDASVSDHTGLFEKWITYDKTFVAVEGNTSPNNWSNGGAVARMERNIEHVSRFIHVGR